MTRDRIDALAAQLFAAAREERPDRELVDRVEYATSGADAGSGEHRVPAAERQAGGVCGASGRGRSGRLRPPLLVRALLAAIACGGLTALLLLPRARDGVLISAERSPGASGARPATVRTGDGVAASSNGDEVASTEAAPAPGPRQAPQREAAPATDRAASSAPEAAASAASAPRTGAEPPSRGSSPTPQGAAPARAARPDATEAAPSDEHAPAAAAASSTLSNELGVLKQIRRALRNGDGSAALALLDRYDTGEYGVSLALEASVLRIEALDAVGRQPDAEGLARRFVRDNPDSPLAERAQRFIGRSEPARPATGAQP